MTYVETTHRSLGGNIGKSIFGAVIGLILFIAAFPVLWLNEGTADLSKLTEKAIIASQENPQEGFVAYSGTLSTKEQLKDDVINEVEALQLLREAETYAWKETKKSKTQKNVGGSSDTVTTYSYSKVWTEKPKDASRFKEKGYTNIISPYKSTSFRAKNILVDNKIEVLRTLQLPQGESLMDFQIKDKNFSRSGNYAFRGKGSIGNPEIGDVRISYEVVPNNAKGTLFAELKNNKITPYREGENKLYRFFYTDKEGAKEILSSERSTKMWLFRALGLGMMVIGVVMFLGVIEAIGNIIPFIGSIFRGISILIGIVIALVLGGSTILIAKIFYNPLLLILTIVLVATGIFFYNKKKEKGSSQETIPNQSMTNAPPSPPQQTNQPSQNVTGSSSTHVSEKGSSPLSRISQPSNQNQE